MGTLAAPACITRETAIDSVYTPSIPGLIAAQKGRYTLAKGFNCSGWTPPHVSLLVARDTIWIGLRFGRDSLSDYPPEPDRSWRIHKLAGAYDWPAVGDILLQARALVSERHQRKAERDLLRPAPILSMINPSPEIHEVEIAAEEEVQYASLLNAMDVAVAAQFEIAYVTMENSGFPPSTTR